MKKIILNLILVTCFSLSSVNAALATQIVESSPIIVQPYDLREISQQMLAQDRINRDQELAIRGLIDDNQRLADTALARQQDATLEKVNQTMAKYRDYLIARDQLRITAYGQRISKYHDLIVLTEDVDDMKDAGQTLRLKGDTLAEKYIMLTQLKDEMAALNEKLKGKAAHENVEVDKIQLLTQRLGEMDQRIARYDGILAAKDRQIAKLNESVRWLNQVAAANKHKAEYYQLTSDSLKNQLGQLETELTQKKEQLDLLKSELENKITEANNPALKNQLGRLGAELAQKKEQVGLLKPELENKITEINNLDQQIKQVPQGLTKDDRLKLARELIELHQEQAALLAEKSKLTMQQYDIFERHFDGFEARMKNSLAEHRFQAIQKNQGLLQMQIQDLKSQLQDKENQIAAMKTASDQTTLMLSDYQKKLESKNNAYNEQLGQILASRNYQAQMEKQYADLNARIQQKEAQVVKIKKDMYDLQESTKDKDQDLQAKDLSLSMEQKMTDEKIKGYQDKIRDLTTELALDRERLRGMPSSDEIDYLRTGLAKAAAQLKQKDAMLAATKANADEYEKEFKAQSKEFQSLKEQLQSAYVDINRKNEDLKYKDLAIVRLKERSAIKEGDLSDQVRALTKQLKTSGKIPPGNTPENKIDKLKQALDKIDEQGRMINVLVEKLRECGQSADLTRE